MKLNMKERNELFGTSNFIQNETSFKTIGPKSQASHNILEFQKKPSDSENEIIIMDFQQQIVSRPSDEFFGINKTGKDQERGEYRKSEIFEDIDQMMEHKPQKRNSQNYPNRGSGKQWRYRDRSGGSQLNTMKHPLLERKYNSND